VFLSTLSGPFTVPTSLSEAINRSDPLFPSEYHRVAAKLTDRLGTKVIKLLDHIVIQLSLQSPHHSITLSPPPSALPIVTVQTPLPDIATVSTQIHFAKEPPDEHKACNHYPKREYEFDKARRTSVSLDWWRFRIILFWLRIQWNARVEVRIMGLMLMAMYVVVVRVYKTVNIPSYLFSVTSKMTDL
jgi:hypothetical protein